MYPSDFWFSVDMTKWKPDKTTEFPGSSHERITIETYVPGV